MGMEPTIAIIRNMMIIDDTLTMANISSEFDIFYNLIILETEQ
jgi:hypothetical protein